jgi:hypothetical protein
MDAALVDVNGFMLPAKYAQEAMKSLNSRRKVNTIAVPEAQQAMPFVTADERAEMATAYTKSERRAQESLFKDLTAAVKSLQKKAAQNQLLSYDEVVIQRLLEHPLITSLPSDLDEIGGQEEINEASKKEVETEKPSTLRSESYATHDELPVVWTDKEVYMLTEGILEYTFGILKSRGNVEEKIEALDWIWASDVHSYRKVRINNRVVLEPVLSKFIPFTFAFCCAINGLNVDTLRDALRVPLAPVLEKLGLSNYIASHK